MFVCTSLVVFVVCLYECASVEVYISACVGGCILLSCVTCVCLYQYIRFRFVSYYYRIVTNINCSNATESLCSLDWWWTSPASYKSCCTPQVQFHQTYFSWLQNAKPTTLINKLVLSRHRTQAINMQRHFIDSKKVDSSKRPVNALAVKKYDSLTDNLKSRDASI